MLLYSCLLNTRVPHLVSFSYCATCAWPVLTVDSNCNTISQCCVPTWPPSGRRTIRGASILTVSFDLAGSKPDLSFGYEVCVAISQIRLAIPLRTPSTICHRHLQLVELHLWTSGPTTSFYPRSLPLFWFPWWLPTPALISSYKIFFFRGRDLFVGTTSDVLVWLTFWDFGQYFFTLVSTTAWEFPPSSSVYCDNAPSIFQVSPVRIILRWLNQLYFKRIEKWPRRFV